MVIDPADTYLLLDASGHCAPLAGGEAFWQKSADELNAIGNAWLVSEFRFDSDWPNWEMHPEADEVVYLLEGHVELLLQLPEGLRSQRIEGRGAVVVPRGIWHTARTNAPCRMLHLTMGKGTQTRARSA
jgi:mannose-6-phosphate isomerase-like protein (cupin superfamily)